MLQFDLTSRDLESADESVDGLGLVKGVEVIGTEVVVLDPVAQHVVRGGGHGGRDGEDGLFGSAPGLEA